MVVQPTPKGEIMDDLAREYELPHFDRIDNNTTVYRPPEEGDSEAEIEGGQCIEVKVIHRLLGRKKIPDRFLVWVRKYPGGQEVDFDHYPITALDQIESIFSNVCEHNRKRREEKRMTDG